MKNESKNKAIKLRTKGRSMREIQEILGISKSTVSLWTRNVKLSEKAKKRLNDLSVNGRKKGIETNKKIQEQFLNEINDEHDKNLKKLQKGIFLDKLLCSMLYWCEGEKTNRALIFVNSDPTMVKTFLRLLRSAYKIDEAKFRIILHLHEHHDELKQKEYWSKITSISKGQFHKVFWKKDGNYKKVDYQGCVSIRYHDHKVAKDLTQLWAIFGQMGA